LSFSFVADMPQRLRVDEHGVIACRDDVATVAIDRPQKIGGAYHPSQALEKAARGCFVFARQRFDPFHPAVTLSSQNTTSFQLWMKRESIHPMQERGPFPLAVAGSRFVNHRTGRELEQRDSAALIVRIGQSTTHINDGARRLTAEEMVRKSGPIRGQPG